MATRERFKATIAGGVTIATGGLSSLGMAIITSHKSGTTVYVRNIHATQVVLQMQCVDSYLSADVFEHGTITPIHPEWCSQLLSILRHGGIHS